MGDSQHPVDRNTQNEFKLEISPGTQERRLLKRTNRTIDLISIEFRKSQP